jgi:hypothetical protein
MPYTFIQDVPANEEIYGQIRARLGEGPPKGLVVHLAVKHDGGLRYIDVWDTRADWERFREERVEPVVSDVRAGYGLPHDHSLVRFEEIDVIDIWMAEPAAG